MKPAPSASAPRPNRRELARQTTEQAVRAAALELFTEQGFDATTTKQIAERAGVSHGTVFVVAATKEALLVKVLEEQLRQVVASRAESLPSRGGPRARILYLFDGLFDFYAASPELSRAFLKHIIFFTEPVAQAQYDEHVARFTTYLASLLAPARNASTLASAILALYLHAVIAFLNAPTPDRAALGARFRAGLSLLLK